MIAASLLVWLATIGLDADDPLRRAEPTTIRYRLLHVAGKITRSARRARLHVDRSWPWPPRWCSCSPESARCPCPADRAPAQDGPAPCGPHAALLALPRNDRNTPPLPPPRSPADHNPHTPDPAPLPSTPAQFR